MLKFALAPPYISMLRLCWFHTLNSYELPWLSLRPFARTEDRLCGIQRLVRFKLYIGDKQRRHLFTGFVADTLVCSYISYSGIYVTGISESLATKNHISQSSNEFLNYIGVLFTYLCQNYLVKGLAEYFLNFWTVSSKKTGK